MESSTDPSCQNCAHRAERPFCALSGDAIREFDEVKEQLVLGRGELLFAEGRPARGVYVLCDGRAKLTVSSENGRRLMLRVAGAGEFLGLESCLRGENHDFTVELLDNARIAFIKRKDLLRFLRDNPVLCMAVVGRLSEHLHGAYERVRNIGLNRPRRVRTQRDRTLAS